MMKILVLSWRNLFRNRRRTLITMSAIAFGLILLIVAASFGDGSYKQMIRYGTANQAGHVVVQARGYQKEKKVELVVPEAAEVLSITRRAVPEAVVVERIFFDGLITSPRSAVGAALVGVDPVLEAKVGDLDSKIVEGRYLEASDERGIVIGTGLAETLAVEIGDKLVLVTQQNGEIQNVLFRVVGLFKTGMDELDGFYAHVPLKKAQEALMLGGGVSQISLHLPDVALADDVTEALTGALAGREVEVLPWQEALPELYEAILLDRGGLYMMVVIIAIVVCFGILNTVLMSVLERTHELGVMLSLGMTPWQVGKMILTEATLLGLLAIALGAGLGALLTWPLVVNGVDLAEMAGKGGGNAGVGGIPMDLVIYADLSVLKVGVFSAITFGLTLLAAIYPTWKAARLHPVEAIHHH